MTVRAQGEEIHSEPESSGDEEEEEGEITSSPTLRPLKTFPCLVTSSVGKRGSPLVLAGQNFLGWTPGGLIGPPL
jgi:hypothetical protein